MNVSFARSQSKANHSAFLGGRGRVRNKKEIMRYMFIFFNRKKNYYIVDVQVLEDYLNKLTLFDGG